MPLDYRAPIREDVRLCKRGTQPTRRHQQTPDLSGTTPASLYRTSNRATESLGRAHVIRS